MSAALGFINPFYAARIKRTDSAPERGQESAVYAKLPRTRGTPVLSLT